MRLHSTDDVPLRLLAELRDDLAPEFDAEPDSSQTCLSSIEPPSWLNVFAEGDWWIKTFSAYAALYVAELVREAAKDTWKSRGKAIAAAKVAGGRLAVLASRLGSFRPRLPGRTRVFLAIPVPDAYFGTRLEVIGSDPNEIAVQLALFAHYLPALQRLVEHQQLSARTVATGVLLRLQPDLSLEVSWSDRESLSPKRVIISLVDSS